MTTNRRKFLAGSATLAGAGVAAPAVVRAQTRTWRMVTSWPKNLPGPGTTAQFLADQISTMSNGRLTVTVHAAGELVPGLGVLDAVAGKVAQMGHTASFFWTGKMPASAFFTAVPFGLTPMEHIAWIEHGGGQDLWDQLYEPFRVKPLMAGNSGMQMGGWLKKEVKSLDDLKGLRFRIPGLGGAMMKKLGVVPVLMAPSEILPALQSGAIDGTEFLGPWSDRAAGFYKAASNYYWPGFHEPNGTGECLVNLKSWKKLPDDLKQVVENACRAANVLALSETEWRNAEALQALKAEGVNLRRWPDDVVRAAKEAAKEVILEFGKGSDIEQRIYLSYETMRARSRNWSQVGAEAYLTARNG